MYMEDRLNFGLSQGLNLRINGFYPSALDALQSSRQPGSIWPDTLEIYARNVWHLLLSFASLVQRSQCLYKSRVACGALAPCLHFYILDLQRHI